MNKLTNTLFLFLATNLFSLNSVWGQCEFGQIDSLFLIDVVKDQLSIQQYFTPECSGSLNSIELSVSVFTAGQLKLDFGTGEEEGFVPVTTGSLALAAGSGGTRTLVFDDPVEINADTEYTIEVSIEESTDVSVVVSPLPDYVGGIGRASKIFEVDNGWINLGVHLFFQVTIDSSLPVELSYFEALQEGKDVALQWATESELNNAGFEIQRSADGASFENIAWLAGQNQQNGIARYEYREPVSVSSTGKWFYRLLQRDYDGKETYFDIREVKLDYGAADMELLQTRLYGTQLHLTLTEACQGESYTVRICNANGQKLFELPFDGNCHQEVELPQSGLYYLQVLSKKVQVREAKKLLVL